MRFSIYGLKNKKLQIENSSILGACAKNKKKYGKQKTENQNTLKNKEKVKIERIKILNFIFFAQTLGEGIKVRG